jgi:hypothetical protein
VRILDLHAWKKLAEVEANHVFEHRKRQTAPAGQQRWNGHEARQHVGHFHAREPRAPVTLDDDREVLAAFEMYGNGWPGSNASGVSTGADALAEIILEVLLNLGSVVRRLGDRDFLVAQQRRQSALPTLGLVNGLIWGGLAGITAGIFYGRIALGMVMMAAIILT